MNAAIRAVVRTAISKGYEGKRNHAWLRRTFAGRDREHEQYRCVNIIFRGGTILYTARCMEFVTAEGQQQGAEICHKARY